MGITSMIKILAIVAAIGMISAGIWKYTAMVKQVAVYQLNEKVYETTIDNLEKQNELIEKTYEDTLKAIENLQSQIEELERLDEVTENLPDDSQEVAPESIRETLRRLGETE